MIILDFSVLELVIGNVNVKVTIHVTGVNGLGIGTGDTKSSFPCYQAHSAELIR